MDQTWSNLIRLDFSQIKKCSYKKFSHLQKDKNSCLIFDFFGSDLSEINQTWSNLIKLDQTWSNLIKLDQTCLLNMCQYLGSAREVGIFLVIIKIVLKKAAYFLKQTIILALFCLFSFAIRIMYFTIFFKPIVEQAAQE